MKGKKGKLKDKVKEKDDGSHNSLYLSLLLYKYIVHLSMDRG